MALFHLSVTQTKRSAGQSAIASAAYRAGERLYSEYYGEYSDYTRKGGVICSDILLPSHAPPEYADRQTLWNAVEKAERGKNAQLAYSFDIALQNEFSLEENIALARQFLLENFVSRGMVVDFAVHQPDREDGGIPNPHFHVLCPIRPIEQNGKWGLKQRRVYELDEDGNRIRDADGKFVFNAVPTTDWGSPETLEYWRQTWAELCNAKFAEKGLDVRIDHRSYERQGVDLLPTTLMPTAVSLWAFLRPVRDPAAAAPHFRDLQPTKFQNTEEPYMGFNYAAEKKKFETLWARLRREYRAAGMSDTAIQKMHDFDWEVFKQERIYRLHTQDLGIGIFDEPSAEQEDKSALMKKFLESVSRWDDYTTASRYGWIEGIGDQRLVRVLKRLSISEKELLTKYCIEDKTQQEIAAEMGLSQRAVGKQLQQLKNFFRKF